jgi:hypothetical protein
MQSWDQTRERLRAFEQALKAEQFEEAIAILPEAADCAEVEHYVRDALYDARARRRVLDATLATFASSRVPLPLPHGNWVHSLSHFHNDLWGLGKVAWLKDAYRTALGGAREFGNYTCCDQLVSAFAYHAPWPEVPADFGIDVSAFSGRTWGRWNAHVRRRIDASPFVSELEYCRFLLANPPFLRRYRGRSGSQLDFARIFRLILRQAQAGHDVADLLATAYELVRSELRLAQEHAQKATRESDIDEARRTIEMLEWVVGKDTSDV